MKKIPVAIETMSRYEHFRKCVESLSRNKFSEYTDLYISVDYPPDDSSADIEGYIKIKEWLNEKPIKRFKSVSVFIQDKNLGPYENFVFLNERVAADGHEAIIRTEDDNVFSENFLEYMNEALMYIKNDNSITSVVGYLHDEGDLVSKYYEGYTAFSECAYSEWGVGFWLNENRMIENEISFEYLYEILKERNKRKKIIDSSWNNYELVIMGYLGIYKHMQFKDGTLAPIDQMKRIWNIVNNKKQMLPTINKVKNIGLDGSGLHVPKLSDYKMNEIDKDTSFVLKYSPEYFPECRFRNKKMHKVSYFRYLELRFLNLMICLFGERFKKIFN